MKPRADIGELERDVMQLIWAQGSATAEQVREQLNRSLKESTVRTVLQRLEKKGFLKHAVENRTFIYRPAQERQHVAAKAVKRIIDWLCEGSVDEVLVGMVEAKMLDKTQIERLAKRIDEEKRTGKSAKQRSKGD